MDDQTEYALKIFNAICTKWGLDDKERADLLEGSEDQMLRIAYVFEISNSLRSLFRNEMLANAFIKRPIDYFNSRTALEIMTKDPLPFARYLNAQLSPENRVQFPVKTPQCTK